MDDSRKLRENWIGKKNDGFVLELVNDQSTS